jgi:hypothetical protein
MEFGVKGSLRPANQTHLHVLFSSLLPLLGHGTRSNGVRKHANGSENREGCEDNTGGEEEDVAALIRRRWAAGAVRTEGNVVC